MRQTTRKLWLAALLLICAATPTAAQTNVMFIFDASGSMRKAAGAESRIIAAKRAFGDTLAAMPAEVRTGLVAFGHRRRKDCSDIEVVSPVGADAPGALASLVRRFDALGETPIAAAIDRAGDAMRAFKGQANSIVLVTDGVEECGGDPCEAARRLVGLGIDVKVHVVGFALGAGEGDKLQCITRLTGGRYFDATDAGRLGKALADVRQEVAQVKPAAPPPAQPARKILFTEDFNGNDLSRDTWEVLNENKDFYIVENGSLMLVGPSGGGFGGAKTMNIFRLNQDLPEGNWDIVVDARVKTQTRADDFSIGLYGDATNFLSAHLMRADNVHRVQIDRKTGDQLTKSSVVLTDYFGEDQKVMAKVLGENGVRMILSKRDRRYTATVEIKDWSDKQGKPRIVTTQEITSLRLPGRFAMMVGKHDPSFAGETIAFVDKVEIVAVE